MAGPASPSAQRLPSPPPFPEVQIGPKSPGIPTTEAEDTAKYAKQAVRRIRPGTKAADIAGGPALIPLSQLDTPFQLQEYLDALFHHHTRSLSSPDDTIALTHETALQIASPPSGVDRSLWLYELTRLCVLKANSLIIAFFAEDPPCSALTCPEMRASEWQYLCAVHEPPKPCCAIDYCCHTLDWACNTLTSNQNFPSRLTLGNETKGGSVAAMKNLTNVMRRVYRIFAHAWFQHRSVFWQVEGQVGLYVLFKTICDVYALIPEENYTIPPEAEGLTAKEDEPQEGKAVLKKPQQAGEEATPSIAENADTTTTISTGLTTRRHKATPSVGSMVGTIQEGDEEDKEAGPLAKENGPLDTLASSMTKEAPLAQISKTAEKKEESPTREASEVEETAAKSAQGGDDTDKESGVAVVEPRKEEATKEEEPTEASVAGRNTAAEASTATKETEEDGEKEG